MPGQLISIGHLVFVIQNSMVTISRSFTNCLPWTLPTQHLITPERIKEAFRASHLSCQVNHWCTPAIQALPNCKSRLTKFACIQCLSSGSVLKTMLLIELCTIKCIWWEAGDCYKNDVNVLWKLFCAGKVMDKASRKMRHWGKGPAAQIKHASCQFQSCPFPYTHAHTHQHLCTKIYKFTHVVWKQSALAVERLILNSESSSPPLASLSTWARMSLRASKFTFQCLGFFFCKLRMKI